MWKKKLKRRGRRRGGRKIMIRKMFFKEHNAPRDSNRLGFKIKNFVTLVLWRITYENMRCSSWRKFMAPLFEGGNIN